MIIIYNYNTVEINKRIRDMEIKKNGNALGVGKFSK